MIKTVTTIASALSDENRVRMLAALAESELCVCQVTELTGLATSTVSKHLTILKDAGLVETRKNGRWVFYRLPRRGAEPAAKQAIKWLQANFPSCADDADTRKLEAILAVEPEVICARQARR